VRILYSIDDAPLLLRLHTYIIISAMSSLDVGVVKSQLIRAMGYFRSSIRKAEEGTDMHESFATCTANDPTSLATFLGKYCARRSYRAGQKPFHKAPFDDNVQRMDFIVQCSHERRFRCARTMGFPEYHCCFQNTTAASTIPLLLD
jgi:hypothetical protein